jgi:quercetin dioxygenase-like cupin family protein
MAIWKSVVSVAVAASVIGLAAAAEQAQQGSLKRATLQTGEFPPGYETVMIIAQMEPGKCSGWHTHPGLESSYFLEGEVLIHFAGKPDLVVKAGQPVLIEPRLPHNDCNVNGKPFKALAHYIVEKGKPLASPVPAPLTATAR